MKIMYANRIAPDGMPRFAASHLGLFCLPMSHKKDARLIWVNMSWGFPTMSDTNQTAQLPKLARGWKL